MNTITRAVVTALATVWLAYSIAYFITLYLPSSGLFTLGIFATEDILRDYDASLDTPKSYLEALLRLVHGEFGLSLDRRPVGKELVMALSETIPLLLGCILFQFAVLFLSIYTLPVTTSNRLSFFKFLAFLPAYLSPLIAFLVIVTFGWWGSSGWQKGFIVFLSAVIPVSSFLLLMVHAFLREICGERHYFVLQAYGFSERQKRRRIVRNLLFAMLPALHKILSLQVAVLLFTESVFSNGGFGAQLFFAFRRTDINIILVSIFLLSCLIALTRFITVLVDLYMFGDVHD